ncbi:MAG TPA: PEP-CTERM sorting domain-containing protein [Terrimicrobiaceae bacterium]|nr:PEP-CTERM sorting domain-containing protein [Terrimicrobiaceae bacterium]
MKTIASGLVLGILSMAATLPLQAAQIFDYDGVTWSVGYQASAGYLPNEAGADPAWTYFSVANGASATINNDLLELNSPNFAAVASAEMDPALWDGNSGGQRENTVQFNMRAVSTDLNDDRPVTRVLIADGLNLYFFTVTVDSTNNNGWVSFSDSGNYAINTTVFHTYRITSTSSGANLYIDGAESPVLTSSGVSSSNNYLSFGDDTAGNIGAGISYWDYVYYTNNGAFAPVPEPHSTALLFGGIGVLLMFWRRNRRLAS